MSSLAPRDQPDVGFKDNIIIAFNLRGSVPDEVPIKRGPDRESGFHWLSKHDLSTGLVERQCQFTNNLFI